MELDKALYADIKEYCKLNGLKVGEYINRLLKEAFLTDKYGSAPPMFKKNSTFVPSEPVKVPVSTKTEEIVVHEEEKPQPVEEEQPVQPKNTKVKQPQRHRLN